MTIPRVLMAAALLVLGFMILGIQQNMLKIGGQLDGAKGELVQHLSHIGNQLSSAHAKLDTVMTRQKGRGRIGKPRVKPVPHLRPTPLLPQPVNPFDPFFGDKK
jgi:hypothetical protein